MNDGLYRVTTSYLCAGFVVENGEVTVCAPILRKRLSYWQTIAEPVRRNMSEKNYAVAQGIVQKFGDKPAISEKEVSGQIVREFTFKSLSTQALVRCSLWPELGGVADQIVKGAFVAIDGSASTYSGKDGKQYHSISASEIVVVPPYGKTKREVVNNNQTQPAAQPVAPETPANGPGF